MHLKRQEVPTSWPTYRKGTKYVVRPFSNLGSGVPLLLVLRDMIKIARNRKEVKRAIFLKQILVNSRIPRDEKKAMLLFDTISILPTKKNYKLGLSEKGKFLLIEIKENEAHKKVAKIVDKKILRGKKVQLNLSDGRNLLSNINCQINDSLIINLKEKKAEKCIPLKSGSSAIVFSGKHAGKMGEITGIDLQKKIIELLVNEEKLNVLIRQIMVVE